MKDEILGLLLALGILAVICTGAYLIYSVNYAEQEEVCKKACGYLDFQLKRNYRSSDECFCVVDGELKLKRIF